MINDKKKNTPDSHFYRGCCDPFNDPNEFFKTGIMWNNQQTYSVPSNKFCIEIASKIPVTCLQELFDNAEKIK